jgi:hypothetical protein
MVALVVGLAVPLSACTPAKPTAAADPRRAEAVLSRPWPFRPVAMRIHPLTRLAADSKSGVPIIEARIELRDADGQVTRGVGKVRIALRLNRSNQVAQFWEFNLFDLDSNRDSYDSVTRTYRLVLPIADPALLQSAAIVEIDAYFSADFEANSTVILRGP